MPGWSQDELDRIGAADELRVASLRADDTLSSWRTIWVARVGDDVFVRSVYGPESDWYRNTRARHLGRISAGGVERDVEFVDADASAKVPVDEAYRGKYRAYADSIVNSIVSSVASSTTMRLDPRPAS